MLINREKAARIIEELQKSNIPVPEELQKVAAAPEYASVQEFLKAKKFAHQYDEATQTIKMQYGMRLVCAAAPEVELITGEKAAFGNKVGNGPDFFPTDEELAKINALSGRKNFKKEDFKVFYAVAADSNVDRHFEHFTGKALQSMAATSADQPFMLDHNYYASRGVVGKIFDAKVNEKDGVKRLLLKVYIRNNGNFQDVIDGLEDGTNNKGSVGITLKVKDVICDVCNKQMWKYNSGCTHYPGQELDDDKVATAKINDVIELREFSRVTVPAQPGAAFKSDAEGGEMHNAKSANAPQTQTAKINSPNLPNETTETPETPTDSGVAAKSSEHQPEPTIRKDEQHSLGNAMDLKEVADAMQKAVAEQLQKSFDEQKSAVEAVVNELKATNAQLVETNAKLAADIEAQKAAHAEKEAQQAKEIEELRGAFKGLADIYKDAMSKFNNLSGVSVQKLAQEVGNMLAQAKGVEAKSDSSLRNTADGEIYKSAVERLSQPQQ